MEEHFNDCNHGKGILKAKPVFNRQNMVSHPKDHKWLSNALKLEPPSRRFLCSPKHWFSGKWDTFIYHWTHQKHVWLRLFWSYRRFRGWEKSWRKCNILAWLYGSSLGICFLPAVGDNVLRWWGSVRSLWCSHDLIGTQNNLSWTSMACTSELWKDGIALGGYTGLL